MKRQFTAGAERAITEAAGWSGPDDSCELETPALLLGLLAESECRAAITLARHGIDAEAVRSRWPALRPATQPDERAVRAEGRPCWSAEVEASLSAVAARLHEHPQPLVLATEHFLLALATAEDQVGVWLREQGVDPESLEAEIHCRSGHQAGPLPLDVEPPDAAGETRIEPAQPLRQATTPAELEGEMPAFSGTPPQEQVGLLRVIDAAANRAGEGLRVVEDYVRFVLDDRHLTDQFKRLRHDLTAILASVAMGRRLAARETQADVGTRLATCGERLREDTAGVLTANFTRLQQSLRTLEEFGKVLDPDLGAGLEQLRYRSYTLQRAVEITGDSLRRLAGARLYVLIDGRSSPGKFVALARSLVDAGAHVLQLRDKTLDDRRLLERARLLRETTRRGETLFIMNDRPDLAALAGADGVHVGQEEVSVKDARTIVGAGALVGVSTHSIEQARQAVLDGASYVGCGPVFASSTKRFDEFPGTGLLRSVAAEIRLPAFAIGGITRENLPGVLGTGFRRVAVSAAVMAAENPAGAVRELLAGLGT